jgi:excisionase family DNA binding protein
VPVMEVFTVDEVALKIKKGRTWTWGLVRSGDLESFMIGGRRVVSADALDAYLKRTMAASARKGSGK